MFRTEYIAKYSDELLRHLPVPFIVDWFEIVPLYCLFECAHKLRNNKRNCDYNIILFVPLFVILTADEILKYNLRQFDHIV